MKAGIISKRVDNNLFIVARVCFNRHGEIGVRFALKSHDKYQAFCRWLETSLEPVQAAKTKLSALPFDTCVWVANIFANAASVMFVERCDVIYDCREGWSQLNETSSMEAECDQVLRQITRLVRCDTLLRICEVEACRHTIGNYSLGWSRESAKGMRRELKKEKGPLSNAVDGWSVLWPYIDSHGNVFIKCVDDGHRHPIVDSSRACDHVTPFRLAEWGLMLGDANSEHETIFYRW